MIDLQSTTPTELRKLIKEQPEEVVKAILDGVTDTVTTVEEDAYHNRTRQLDITRNRYDGNLVGQQEVTWTYHDAKVGNVDAITVDKGIGEKQRKVIRHSVEGAVLSMEAGIVAEPTPIGEALFEAAAGGVSGVASGVSGLVQRIFGRAANE